MTFYWILQKKILEFFGTEKVSGVSLVALQIDPDVPSIIDPNLPHILSTIDKLFSLSVGNSKDAPFMVKILLKWEKKFLSGVKKFENYWWSSKREKNEWRNELRDRWLNNGKSQFSKRIYNFDWPFQRLNCTILSKFTTTWYHQIACGRGRFNERMSMFNQSLSPLCRFGCLKPETVDHIFSSCHALDEERALLRDHCHRLDVRYDLKSLFTNSHLQLPVEKFLLKIVYHH